MPPSSEPTPIITVDLSEHPVRLSLIYLRHGVAEITSRIEISFEELTQSLAPEDSESKEEITEDITADEDAPLPQVAVEEDATPGSILAKKIALLNLNIPIDEVACIAILPTRSYFSVPLSLPFTDPKKIAKVLPSEVQDLCPFEIDDFLLTERTFATAQGVTVDVSGMEKNEVRKALSICTHAGLTATMLVSPTSVLCGFSALVAADPLPESYVVIFAGITYTALAFFNEGRLIKEHLFPARLESPEVKQLIKCAVLDCCGDDLARVFVIGEYRINFEIPNSDVIHVDCQGAWSLSQCASAAMMDPHLNTELANFRVGALRYNPLARAAKLLTPKLLPPVGAFLLALCLILGSLYWVRSYRIDALQDEISGIVASQIPLLNAPRGEERNVLQNQLQITEQQLSELGNPSERTAFATLGDISRFFPPDSDIKIRKLVINGDKVTIEGTAPKYENVDKVKDRLRRKRKIFCNIESATRGGQKDGKTFTFDIRMCAL